MADCIFELSKPAKVHFYYSMFKITTEIRLSDRELQGVKGKLPG